MSSKTSKQPQKLYSNIIVLGLLTVFLFVFPFQKALFMGMEPTFEYPMAAFFLYIGILSAILAFILFYHFETLKEKGIVSFAIFLIPLSYYISSFFAASSHQAGIYTVLHLGYAVLFLCAVFLAQHRTWMKSLVEMIVISGSLLVLYNFAVFYDWANYMDALWGPAGRFSSVFQYPNTYAAFLVALLLANLFLMSQTHRIWKISLYALSIAPILLSFLLTLSRGAIVILPFLLAIILIWLPLYRQILMVVSILIGSGVALWLSGDLEDKGMFLLLIGTLVAGGLIVLCEWYVRPYMERWKLNRSLWTRVVMPVLSVIAAFLGFFLITTQSAVLNILPDQIQNRVSQINLQTHGVLERQTFFRDSLKIVQDYPVFGTGGGGWSALHKTYQSNPYNSTQAHTFFLQYIVETGIFGLLIFLLIFGYIIYRYFRTHGGGDPGYHYVFWIFLSTILLHSLIDFHMSYAFIAGLVFLCLGGMFGVSKLPLKITTSFSKIRWLPLLLLPVTILMWVGATPYLKSTPDYLMADRLYRSGSGTFDQIIDPLDRALQHHPSHPRYNLMKISLSRQAYEQTGDMTFYEEAWESLNLMEKRELYDRPLQNERMMMHLASGQPEEALQVIESGLTRHPWDMNLYENAMRLNLQLATDEGVSSELKDQHLEQILYWEEVMKDQIARLEKMPKGQNQGNPFHFTPEMEQIIQKTYELIRN